MSIWNTVTIRNLSIIQLWKYPSIFSSEFIKFSVCSISLFVGFFYICGWILCGDFVCYVWGEEVCINTDGKVILGIWVKLFGLEWQVKKVEPLCMFYLPILKFSKYCMSLLYGCSLLKKSFYCSQLCESDWKINFHIDQWLIIVLKAICSLYWGPESLHFLYNANSHARCAAPRRDFIAQSKKV